MNKMSWLLVIGGLSCLIVFFYQKLPSNRLGHIDGKGTGLSNLGAIPHPDGSQEFVDELSTRMRLVENASYQIKENALKKNASDEYHSVILGRGFCGTFVAGIRQKMNLLTRGGLKSLMLGPNEGSWTETDYMLAQRASMLENPMLPYGPEYFIAQEAWEKDAFVNARHLYQAKLLNQALFLDLSILAGTVTKIEYVATKSRSPWMVTYVPQKGTVTTIYASEIDICSGLGSPTPIEALSIKGNDIENILEDTSLGGQAKRLVNANDYILSDIHLTGSRKVIAIYGGGGSSSASARKALCNCDKGTMLKDITHEDERNEVYWFSRRGFDDAGSGELANDVTSYLRDRGNRLYGMHQLKRVEQNQEGRLSIVFEYADETLETKERTIVVDQFIYGIGQVGSSLIRTIPGLKILKSPDGVPIGIGDNEKHLKVYGGAASSFNRLYARELADALREQAAPDGDAAGTMPSTMAAVKLDYLLNHASTMGDAPLRRKPWNNSVNVNVDFSETLRIFFQNTPLEQLSSVKREELIDYFVSRRRKIKPTTSGIGHEELMTYLRKENLHYTFGVLKAPSTNLYRLVPQSRL